MNKPLLLFRADANNAIGIGHVMRCLALAEAWHAAGGQAIFVFSEMPEKLAAKLRTEGFSTHRISCRPGSLEDADLTASLARSHQPDWVVVDGDRFGSDFLSGLQVSGLRVLLIDDFAERESFPAQIVLNPNMGAIERPYREKKVDARLCVGERYALLRREFIAQPFARKFPDRGTRLLVSLGGSDPEGLTASIVRCLERIPHCQIAAIAGPGHARPGELQELQGKNVRILLDPPDIRETMEQTDIAVIAAGGTLWELLYMRCAVLSYARNPIQAQVVERLAKRGAVRDMGATQELDEQALISAVEEIVNSKALRREMGDLGADLIDGLGCKRVVRVLQQQNAAKTDSHLLVRVTEDERDAFLEMAVRYFSELDPSFSPREDWRSHYFESIMRDNRFSLRWIERDGKRSGFILYGVENHRFVPGTIGYIYELYVSPEFRRSGLARDCAQQAIQELRSKGVSKVLLEVMEGNAAAKFWRKMDFQKVSERFVLTSSAT